MLTQIILAVIAFTLFAFVLAAVASRNKLIPPALKEAEEAAEKIVAPMVPRNKSFLAPIISFFSHVNKWNEFYLWLPVILIGIIGLAQFVAYLTHRASHEDADTLVGMGFRFFGVILAICGTSIFFNQVTGWYNQELEKLEGWAHVTARTVEIVACIAVFFGILFLAFH